MSKGILSRQVEYTHYSPDLDPKDYRLFSKLKEHLRRRKCSRDNDSMSAVNEWLKKVGENIFRNALEKLDHSCNKEIRIKGEYIENKVIIGKIIFLL